MTRNTQRLGRKERNAAKEWENLQIACNDVYFNNDIETMENCKRGWD